MTVPIRVLVVEDDPLTAEAHCAYLERMPGFQVAGVAGTGSTALRILRDATRIDLVLLDVTLPDTTGIELVRALRSAGIETDVIAVTAVREAGVVRSAVSLGIVQYLIKPFTFRAFAERLEAYRDFRARLSAAEVTDQHEVDSTLALLRRDRNAALPKGLSVDTLEASRRTLREASPSALSASELAERLGLSRVTARRYLEHLAEQGLAERGARHGSPGRPEMEYRAARSAP
ncbi:response regulator [Herbiconiux moechotypicola]|uniref:Transcriptional regulatory protein n=1 Tax=Herbiconiux moechotypicola TaxID=637393 RepID=A0ABN3E7E7_9MICO|nr:response regulator [Herbiconiux moechotypicola]MCS5730722.1 response regulator [Herbiconiux moechotypicola]